MNTSNYQQDLENRKKRNLITFGIVGVLIVATGLVIIMMLTGKDDKSEAHIESKDQIKKPVEPTPAEPELVKKSEPEPVPGTINELEKPVKSAEKKAAEKERIAREKKKAVADKVEKIKKAKAAAIKKAAEDKKLKEAAAVKKAAVDKKKAETAAKKKAAVDKKKAETAAKKKAAMDKKKTEAAAKKKAAVDKKKTEAAAKKKAAVDKKKTEAAAKKKAAVDKKKTEAAAKKKATEDKKKAEAKPKKVFQPEDKPEPKKVKVSEEARVALAKPVETPVAAVPAAPTGNQSNFTLGINAYKAKNYKSSIAAFAKVPVPKSKQRGDVHREEYVNANYYSGLASQKSGNLKSAVKSYKNVLAYEKYFPIVQMNLGICYVELRQFAKADRAFKSVVRDHTRIPPNKYDDVMQRTRYFWAVVWTRLFKSAKDVDKKTYYRSKALTKWKDYNAWYGTNNKYSKSNTKAKNYINVLEP